MNYYKIIAALVFNNSRYNLNFIKEYLLHHFIIETKSCSQTDSNGEKCIGLIFCGLHFLDIFKFLGGATTLNNFRKAY